MSKEPEQLSIEVGEYGAVTALLYAAPKKNRAGITLVLGHGAGGNQLSGFLRMVANGLSARRPGYSDVQFPLFRTRPRRPEIRKRSSKPVTRQSSMQRCENES